MNSGEMHISENGKIIIAGELFEDREINPIIIPIECNLDTGCTYDMVIPADMANGVGAQVEEKHDAGIGAGAGILAGTMRKINIRFGNASKKDVLVFVPNQPISRVLIGIGLLQKLEVFVGINFYSGATEGGILTNDKNIAFFIGKMLHCLQVHGMEIVSRDPCPYCGMSGRTN